MDEEEVLAVVKDSPWNVTLSGGDPFYQAEGFASLSRRIKAETGKTIWCYTGYTLEELVQENDPAKVELLSLIDTLVDGPFMEELRDPDLQFRGSSNQRILQKEEILQMISLAK